MREAHQVGGGIRAIGRSAATGDLANHDRRADGAFGAVVVGSDDAGVEQEREQIRFVFPQSLCDAAAVGILVFPGAEGGEAVVQSPHKTLVLVRVVVLPPGEADGVGDDAFEFFSERRVLGGIVFLRALPQFA